MDWADFSAPYPMEKLAPAMKNSSRNVLLDGWRGVAILALLLGHFVHTHQLTLGVGGPFNFGRMGVELFFVLSGSLMGRLLFIRQDPLPTFYMRRVSRIFPAAITFVALTTITLTLRGISVNYIEPFSALTFWRNYFPGGAQSCFDHFWSLSVEEHSYILLSLVALGSRRFHLPILPTLATMISVCFLCAAWEGHSSAWNYYAYYWHTECRASSVFLGVLFVILADKWRRDPETAPARLLSPVAVTTALCIGLALQASVIPDLLKYTVGTIFLAFTVNHLHQVAAPLQRLLRTRFVTQMGIWSYSLYLWQQPFSYYGYKGLVPAIVLGLLSFYFVEQPARNYLNRRFAPSAH